MKVEEELRKLGLELPRVPKPMGAYVPAARVGDLVYVAGMKASTDAGMKYRGKVGRELTLEQGYDAARVTVLNCLAALKAEIGDLDKVVRIVQVTGFVNSAPGFHEQPKVINGASELLLKLFGERGQHARVAVGVNELPEDSPTEVAMIVQVKT